MAIDDFASCPVRISSMDGISTDERACDVFGGKCIMLLVSFVQKLK